MGRLAPVILLATSLLVAGCLGAEDAPEPVEAAEAPGPVYADDRITIETLEQARVAEPPTLERAPQWTLGEWWSIRLTEEFSGGVHNTTRVVAGAEAGDYLVGMPTHDFSNGIMVLHIPGFGQVGKADLGYEIHDCRFQPLDFPLALDKTWETQFECRDVTATVVAVEGTTATVELLGPNDQITLTYDAEVRAIVSMRKEGYGSYEVLDHGWAFHEDKPGMMGQVTVPHMHDVIFQHGRIAGALWGGSGLPTGLGPQAPFDEVEVATTYDRVSFVLLLGDVLTDGQGRGYYKEVATAPDGTVYELTMGPDEPGPFKVQPFRHDAPGGVWRFDHTAAGPGIALAEGIAYHVYEIVLPQGTIMPSVGEHQHGDPCAHGC